MNVLKNILIGVGAVFLLLVLLLVILGVKIVGTVLFWILCVIGVIWLLVWVSYMIGRSKGRNDR